MTQEWQMHCLVCLGLTSDTAVNPESLNCSFMIPQLWFSPQREKLIAVIASLNGAQDVYTLSWSMAMCEAVRNEKSLKPVCIKPYIVSNYKCHLIQPVLTWLWSSMFFLPLLDLHPKFICTASSARARPRRWHYVTRKHYPGASAFSSALQVQRGNVLAWECP